MWPNNGTARLEVIDPATDDRAHRVKLVGALDSQCRPVYADGIIVVPLAGGALQALSASTLETIWYVDGIDGAVALVAHHCEWLRVCGDGRQVGQQLLRCYCRHRAPREPLYGLRLQARRRAMSLATTGLAVSRRTATMWWSNDASAGARVYGGSHGARVERGLSGSVRSTIVEADGYLYLTTSDGVLHKLFR